MPVPYYNADAYSNHIPTRLRDFTMDFVQYQWWFIAEKVDDNPLEEAYWQAQAEMQEEAWAECDGYYRDMERSLNQYDWLSPLNQAKRFHLQQKISGFSYFSHVGNFADENKFYQDQPEYRAALADFVPDARQTKASAGHYVMEYLFEWAQPFGIDIDSLVRRLYGTFEFDTLLKDLGIGMELMLPVRHVPQLVATYLSAYPLASLTDLTAAARFRDTDDWRQAFAEYLRLGFAGNLYCHEQAQQQGVGFPRDVADEARAWQTGVYPMLQADQACFWHGLDVEADFEPHHVINRCRFYGPFPRDFIERLPDAAVHTDIERCMAACELAEQVLNRYFVALMRAAYNNMAKKRHDLLVRQAARYNDLLRIEQSQYQRRQPPAGWQEAEPLI
ncbi:hypothetical protein [Conchiformibius steedae]|uniref:hypothetical protein n=1 Tax=Conchiformibius steedae TaxID=153493 RepID=UPI0026EF7653|nr:hypothetical protein [Conchiformibius steedae]